MPDKDFRVLVVEDDATCLKLVTSMMTALGIKHVTGATSGSEALECLLAAKSRFDCILADIRMERCNGLQLLQAVRLGMIRGIRPDMCFILMTGSPDRTVIAMAKQLDVNGFVVKPFTPAKLREEITGARSRVYHLDRAKYQAVSLN